MYETATSRSQLCVGGVFLMPRAGSVDHILKPGDRFLFGSPCGASNWEEAHSNPAWFGKEMRHTGKYQGTSTECCGEKDGATSWALSGNLIKIISLVDQPEAEASISQESPKMNTYIASVSHTVTVDGKATKSFLIGARDPDGGEQVGTAEPVARRGVEAARRERRDAGSSGQ